MTNWWASIYEKVKAHIGNSLTITTEAPRIMKIMVVVIICIKTS